MDLTNFLCTFYLTKIFYTFQKKPTTWVHFEESIIRFTKVFMLQCKTCFAFHNIFFLTELVFVSHLLHDFYIVHDCIDHVLTFCFFFFSKIFVSLARLFLNIFFVLSGYTSLDIFIYQMMCEKILQKNNALRPFHHIISIAFLCSIFNVLKIFWKLLKDL